MSPPTTRVDAKGSGEPSDQAQAAGLLEGRHLSMGMSDDFEVAIEEGATYVRVGTLLFGARPAP